MKAVNITLGRDLKSIELHTAADWHIGDCHCDIRAIKQNIEHIKTTDNAFMILNGDLMDNATKASVSDGYSASMPPMEQLNTLMDLFEPVKDKILLCTQGNHEARTFRQDGIDLTALLFKQLGIYDKYVREGGILFLRFGEASSGRAETNGSGNKRMICYSIYCVHGSGGGRKEGAKAIRLADMASIIDADIYIHSHTHLPMIMREGFWRTDVRNSTVAQVDKLFVNTSAQLDYGGYGQTFEFKPSSKETPVIYLCGTDKRYTAKL